ncbi:MAG: nitroreductase family protein [Clostridia bacterium]|nr:nitroreductase family protein [Clostridia bacterium]
MELFDVIKHRRSYRGMYQQKPVSRDQLRAIMEAALAAPSGCNKQTTSVIAVDDPALVKQLGDMLEAPHFASAPAAICILTEKKIAYRDRTYYIQDYSAAIQNALLAIEALGLESCWVEGHITDADRIGRRMADVLGVPENLDLVCYLPVGYAAEEGTRVKKLPFEERAWFNGYRK